MGENHFCHGKYIYWGAEFKRDDNGSRFNSAVSVPQIKALIYFMKGNKVASNNFI